MSMPIKEAYDLVKATQQKVNELLNAPEYVLNLLEINANFKRITGRFEFMGGVLEPTDQTKQSPKRRFGPIKKFMGEEIKSTPKLTKEDLTADEIRKKVFIEKVEKLYDSISDMGAATIMNSYAIEDDVRVLRGVAKRAGVRDFDKRIINEEFIDDIKLGIAIKADEAAKQAEIDEKIKLQDSKRSQAVEDNSDDDDELEEVDDDIETNQTGADSTETPSTPDATNVSLANEPPQKVLTLEDIAADIDLQKLKAEPGDILAFGPKGGKKIIKQSAAK